MSKQITKFENLVPRATPATRLANIVDQTTGSTAGQRTAAGEAERRERQAAGRTQGRKGCKLARISLSLPDTEYSFVKRMASAQGLTLSQFIGDCVRFYRAEHPDLDKMSQELLKAARATVPQDNS